MSTHTPVLVAEVMAQLAPQPGDRLLDATVGHGGHAAAYLEATKPSGTVVGIDADTAALEQAAKVLAPYRPRFTLLAGNFAQLKDSVDGGGILQQGFSHVLFDLGVGSHQLADPARGFSFQVGESLHMRYGVGELPPAQIDSLNMLAQRLGELPDVPQILEGLTAQELAEVIRTYGEERYAGRIARAIKEATSLPSSSQLLAELISASVPPVYRHGRIHPATRTFQALRLAVNRELEALTTALPQAMELLTPGGKIAVISFHSLEDRIVKHFFRGLTRDCVCPIEQPYCTCTAKATGRVLTRRVVTAQLTEIARNPRARSAKLRVLQKIDPGDSG